MFGQNIIKKPFLFYTALAALAAAFILLAAVSPKPVLGADRLAGSDRYETAVKISQAGWHEAEYVILARGDDFADALCAGPLAQKYNAPILFTGKYRLTSCTLEEIKRLEAENVIIVGGRGAIWSNIDDTLDDEKIDTERIYGSNRYETSVKIAQRLGGKEAALTTGEEYADALSVSSAAVAKRFPILLTRPDQLPDVVYKHLNNYKIEKTYLIGGENAISSSIEEQVPFPVRFAGSNRYETNRFILEYFAKDLDFNRILAAPGEGEGNYTYALAGAALAGKTSSPIVLNGSSLPPETTDFLANRMTAASKTVALGGRDVVPSTVINQYEQSQDRVIRSVFDQEGIYGPETGTTTIAGSLAIEGPNIIVQNTIIEGDLLLGEGIRSNPVELRNVTVKGRTTVRGGWDDTITGNSFTTALMVVDIDRKDDDVRIDLWEKSSVSQVEIHSNAHLDDSETTGNGFANVNILGGEDVLLEGTYNTVSFTAAGLDLRLRAAAVSTLNAGSRGEIWGWDTINTANINAGDVRLDLIPSTTKVAQGCRAYVDGERVSEGTYSAADIENLKNDPIDDLEATAGDGEVRLTFSRPRDAESVVLRQSTNRKNWTNAATGSLSKNSTSAKVTGLENDQQYYFMLVVKGGDRAGESNIESATPSAD